MGLFTPIAEDALFLLHSDPEEPLGTYSDHPFQLDDISWPTVMHYYQAMKFTDVNRVKKIQQAPTVKRAMMISGV